MPQRQDFRRIGLLVSSSNSVQERDLCAVRTTKSCRHPSGASIETAGNHQQDWRRRETRGNRCDSVDETSNDLRTSGLKRCIALARHFGGSHHRHWSFEQSDALHVGGFGKFACRWARA
jgi:hypothetical protein